MTPQFVSVTPAKGVRCILMVTPTSDRPFLRIYRHPREYVKAQQALMDAGQPYDKGAWDFDDYEVHHHDMDIVIEEDHAAFFVRPNGDRYIDYDFASLGLRKYEMVPPTPESQDPSGPVYSDLKNPDDDNLRLSNGRVIGSRKEFEQDIRESLKKNAGE